MAGTQVKAEMAEQPAVLRAIADRRSAVRDAIRAALPDRLRGVSLVARGSSDNVAVYARYLLELATGLPVSMVAPSIVTRYHRELDVRDHLVVALSQSGRTPEIVDISSRLHEAGAVVVGITNDGGSPLAGTSTIALSVGTGQELAVPATKTVTGQLALVAALAEAIDGTIADYTGGPRAWDALPDVVAAVLDDEAPLAAAVELLADRRTAIHLARGLTYAAALEGALKSKETSRRVHEGYSSADFLHGPLTVASPDVAVIAYGATGPVLADVADTVARAAALGSPVIGVGAAEVWRGVPGAVGVPVPQTVGEGMAVIPLVVRGQQLAVATTLALGLDPDSPEGLNKVTATH
jgi:glutamine---fructose-6-phosphate transaminase (isomerizing)